MEGVDYQRYMGFLRAMHDHGLETNEDNLIMIHPGILERRSNMQEIYEKSKNYTARIVRPKLTTIREDIREKGRIAVDSLEKLIRGEKPENKNYCLPVELVFRDSVKKITE